MNVLDLIFTSAQVKNELTIGVRMSPASVKQYWSLIPVKVKLNNWLFEVHADSDFLWQYHVAYQDLMCWSAQIYPFTRPNHDKTILIDNDMTVTKSLTFWVIVCNFFLLKRKRKICLMDKSYNKNEKKFKDFLFSFLRNLFFPTFLFQAVRIESSTCHHRPTS